MRRFTAIVTVALSWWIIRTITRKSAGPHPRLVFGLSRARGQSSIPLRIGDPRIVDLGFTACSFAALRCLSRVCRPSSGRALALIHSSRL